MDETFLEVVPESDVGDNVQPRIDGVVIGVLMGLAEGGLPLVAFPGNPQAGGLQARSTVLFSAQDVGREVALLFEGGDPLLPLIIGRVKRPEELTAELGASPPTARLDDERVVLSAEKEIVLKCGRASITLTRAGKVIIRGAYLLSRSSGINRIKGGSVQIN
jgi:hypothetical protein